MLEEHREVELFCDGNFVCGTKHCRVLMGISKTEVNLRRLLAAAPQQQNQAKLVHVSFMISLDSFMLELLGLC